MAETKVADQGPGLLAVEPEVQARCRAPPSLRVDENYGGVMLASVNRSTIPSRSIRQTIASTTRRCR